MKQVSKIFRSHLKNPFVIANRVKQSPDRYQNQWGLSRFARNDGLMWIFEMASIVLVTIVVLSCAAEPEPLKFEEDACHTCKMTLMDKKFGAELVTNKGKVYKFDDLNCMLNFYNSGYLAPEEFQFRLVVDYSQPEKLIPAETAFYVKSSVIRSPMAGEVAAFETESDMKQYKSGWNGIYMSWGEVVAQFK